MAQREFPLRMIAWELTRNCNLNCIHCRAAASLGPHQDELTTDECIKILNEIAWFSSPTIILTGGEPLMREDIFKIIEYGSSLGLRLVMAINGTLLNREKAERLKNSGIKRISISLDGKDRNSHDSFRGVQGSYEAVMKASSILKDIGLDFQINTTVTGLNVSDLDAIMGIVKKIGACAWHVFMLVPVGRGERFKGKELNATEYERCLEWFYEKETQEGLEIKVTCAPHYYRIVKQRGGVPTSAGCLAGKSFMFISHRGIVQPCGYLEVPSGDLRKEDLKDIWEKSSVFCALRDLKAYKGKCGNCRYINICGGCRARAYETHEDILGEEPYCTYRDI